MDDQIRQNNKFTEHDKSICFGEIDITNQTMMAEWIKGELMELDTILVESMRNTNSVVFK
mgnify:CR=1 FL=1